MTSSPSAEPGRPPPRTFAGAPWPGVALGGLILATGFAIAAFGTASDLADTPADVMPEASTADPEPEGVAVAPAVDPPAELVLPPVEPSAGPAAGGERASEPEAEPPEGPAAVEPQAAPSEEPAAVEPQAAALPEVGIRHGRHPAFERFVFDWPEPVDFTVERLNGETVIRFARPARFMPEASLPADRLRVVEATAVQVTGAAASVRSFSLADHRVVVDFYSEAPEARSGAPKPIGMAAAGGGQQNGAAAPAGGTAAPAATPALDAERAVPLGLLQSELYRRDLMIASLLARLEAVERGGPGSRGAALPPPPAMLDGVREAAAGNGVAGPMAPGTGMAERAQGSAAGGDPDEVERALERTLTRAGVLLLRPGQIELEPALSYTRRKTSSPVFVSAGDAGVIFIGEDTVERDEVRASLDVKFGLPFDSQFEVSLPYNYVDQSAKTMVGGTVGAAADGSGQALGNPRLALAKTLTREAGWRPDIVARGYWDTDFGTANDNGVPLTGNFNEVGFSVSAVKRQDPLAFVGGVGYATVFEKNNIEPGDTWSFSAAAVLAASPATSLRLGFTQQFSGEVEVDGDKLDGSDSTSGVLTIGASAVIGRRALIDVALDVGLNDDAPDYAVRLAVPIRFDLPLPRPGRAAPASGGSTL
jgi:hypothetical protein